MLIVSRAGFLAFLLCYLHFCSVVVHVFSLPIGQPVTGYGNGNSVNPRSPIVPSIPHTVASHQALASRNPHPQILTRRKSVITKMKEGFKKAGQAIKKGFQKFGTAVKTGFKKAGTAIKTGFKKAGTAIKAGFKKVGVAIKTAAKKVGGFLKKTGAKIAKFGLKVISTASSVIGRVASFIPGVGKVVSNAFKAGAKATEVASNAIHANLGKKLEKGMTVMDKIQHPVKGAAGKILDIISRRDVNHKLVFQRGLPCCQLPV